MNGVLSQNSALYGYTGSGTTASKSIVYHVWLLILMSIIAKETMVPPACAPLSSFYICTTVFLPSQKPSLPPLPLKPSTPSINPSHQSRRESCA